MESIFQVNLSGLLKVLSDNLYSHKEVFIRELLQNAVDAISARKKEGTFKEFIEVELFDRGDDQVLKVRDNGIGLNQEEVTEFLSRIGSSSKSQDALRRRSEDYIGQFGIGLLSCFMVTDEINVITKSLKAEEVVIWNGRVDGTYSTEVSEEIPQEVGTTVTLKMKDDLRMTPDQLVGLLKLYGEFLGIPIEVFINGERRETIFNSFPWNNGGPQGDNVLNFGREAFNEHFSNYIPLTDSTGKTKGIGYIFPRPTGVATSQHNHVYIKNMLIATNNKDLLPEWAFFVRAVVNSSNLAPTASREDLYKDKAFYEVREELGASIIEYLIGLSQSSPKSLENIISIHNQALKSTALGNLDFFNFISDWFIFPTSEGPLSLEKIKKRGKTIAYVPDIDDFRQIVPIARAQNRLIINAGYIYDADILHLASGQDRDHVYQRIDAEHFGNILKPLDIDVYDKAQERLMKLQDYLLNYDCELEIKQFEPGNIPAIYNLSNKKLMDRDVGRIQDESNDLWAGITGAIYEPSASFNSKLYLNYNNPIVKKLLEKAHEGMEEALIQSLYFNAMLMGHYPLNQQELEGMNNNLIYILNKTY
ncbi:HSP90 family protein [Fulvivirga sediminis]|uniref:HSP90 family protein n=1 Tax=Fulvivirga sediminis TaxID=2803949 RepID=A0A937K2N3_9BACT|nr:HSP90 family protein [Fulvivirga sediminis]MBL3658555.1 HSP90 family protein [Fulvivirga sediminis]